MKGFLCTENSEIGVLTSREANAARKAHRVMNKRSLQEPRMRLRKGPTYLGTAGSLYTQHLGAVKPQTSPPSCHPVLLVLASHRLELLDQMLPSCSKALFHASVARMHPQKCLCWLALTQAQPRSKLCVSHWMQHACHHTSGKYLYLTPAPDGHPM